MSHKGAYHVVNCADFSFCFAFYRRSVRAREVKSKAISITLLAKRLIVIFMSIITLKTFNTYGKLCFNEISKISKYFKNLRFFADGKLP